MATLTCSQRRVMHPRRLKHLWLLVSALCIGSALTKLLHDQWNAHHKANADQAAPPYDSQRQEQDNADVALVVASQSRDDTSWLDFFVVGFLRGLAETHTCHR